MLICGMTIIDPQHSMCEASVTVVTWLAGYVDAGATAHEYISAMKKSEMGSQQPLFEAELGQLTNRKDGCQCETIKQKVQSHVDKLENNNTSTTSFKDTRFAAIRSNFN